MTREEALSALAALVAAPARSESGSAGAVVRETGAAVSDAATPAAGPATSRVSEQLSLITQQLDLLRTVQQAQADAVTANTKALGERAASAAVDVAKSVGGGFLNGFGLSPIVSGLLRLFGGGGGGAAAPAPLVKYSAPDSIQVAAGLSAGQLSMADYGAGDRVRSLAPNVTIQVSAMDSRSFLDRSDDIAQAVRQAMLESHAINDVVNEL